MIIHPLRKAILVSGILFLTTFAWTQTSIIDINKVKTVNGIIEILKSREADTNCIIKGFNLMVYPAKGNIYQVEVSGKKAATELKKIVGNLQVEDILVFSNVLIQCNDSKIAILVSDKKMVLK